MFIRFRKYLASYGVLCFVVGLSLSPSVAQAHAAIMKYKIAPAISLEAMYEGGEPMAQAQITVYAPDNPADPWLMGKTDEKGRFTFTPDQTITGEWAVQARQAGHGAMLHIELGGEKPAGDAANSDSTKAEIAPTQTAQVHTTGQTPMQRGIMIASVVWGFIGTGLFFSRKRKS